MPTSWKRIVENQEIYSIKDFQKAASSLIAEQILYQADSKQRAGYDIVSNYEREFVELLDLFGYTLDHNIQERYVAVISIQKVVNKISITHTLLALVLRKLYDHHMKQGVLNSGVAGISLNELEVAFKESTRRELPMKPNSILKGLLTDMKRWGIARFKKSENLEKASYYVEILPGIQSVVNEKSLAIIKAYAETKYEPNEYLENDEDA